MYSRLTTRSIKVLAFMLAMPVLDGLNYMFWPVWYRPYNENILSRVIYLGERYS
jgi:hypothetical protein